jgi:Right handed beta helix region
MPRISRLLSAVSIILTVAWASSALAQTDTFYVAPPANGGSDSNNGTSSSTPFASLSRAQLAVRGRTSGHAAIVNIYQGTYYLPIAPTTYTGTYAGTLIFNSSSDSGTSTAPVTWQAGPSNTQPVIVSGAVPVGTGGLGLTWTQVSGYTPLNVWKVTLPASVGGFSLQPFEYLFYEPSGSSTLSRRLRGRIESSSSTSKAVGYYMNSNSTPQCISTQTGGVVSTSLCNLGTFMRIANTVTPGSTLAGTGAGACSQMTNANDTTKSKCLDRFYYDSTDPISATWSNLNGTYDSSKLNQAGPPCDYSTGAGTFPQGDVALIQIDAWTIDAMRIACIDATDNVIFLNATTALNQAGGNSSIYNLMGPAVGHRYIIENVRNATIQAQANGQTQLWFLDRSGTHPVLFYISSSTEAPNSDTVLIPQLPYSSQLSNQFPQVSGSTELQDFVGGSLLWATGLKYVTFSEITFEADNFVPSYSTGYNNDINGELSAPQAIDCESCQNVTFDGITVSDTSGSGILIASPPGNTTASLAAQNDTIKNSTFVDLGDSGIRIGRNLNNSDRSTYVVNNITIQNNLIDGYSRVLADGEGVAEGNGRVITIKNNDITDGYHAGISVCNVGCGPYPSGVAVSGSYITSQLNHLWNLMQGVTSDGGSLYYNVGGASGSGTNNLIDSNVVHDTNDASVIDGFLVYPGTGYGGSGLYLDAQTGGVTVKNNVVFHMSDVAVHLTTGPSVGATNNLTSNPNTFQNNILSLAINGMISEENPWPAGCPTSGQMPFTTAQFYANILNFDLNESTASGFSAVTGCTNSCGQKYFQYQDFEANAYWRANTGTTGYPLFCDDTKAFHVLTTPPSSGACNGSVTWLTFDKPDEGSATWQDGTTPSTPVVMGEDDGQDFTTVEGTCSWTPDHMTTGNTGFGTTGHPSDYTLVGAPNTVFNYSNTNTTISSAGRTSGATPPTVPETVPTYAFTAF